ncbi:MAG TPA: glycosyltransferase family 4 protein [Verrucomicrobiae bacterium]|nr:glycosyltransferase family 4 protein [Verrucomicrobiae bacterium]
MKLLVFAHTPPPHHGQSYMVQLMLDGFGGDRRKQKPEAPNEHGIECYLVNARFSKSLEDVGEFQGTKVFLILFFCLQAIWCRFRYGVTILYYVPAPGKAVAVYRDWLVMLICRPFFKRIILHWHAAGLAKWLETSAQIRSRAITYRLFKPVDLSIVLSHYNVADAEKLLSHRIVIASNGIPDPCRDFATTVLPRRRARFAARQTILAGKTSLPGEFRTAGEDPHCVKVLFIAHCTREKGLFAAMEGVVAANRVLAGRHSPLRMKLDAAGNFVSTAEKAEFDRLLLLPEFAETVRHLGFVSGAGKAQALSDADVFCFPTCYLGENQPVNLIEAMAFGLPIVTTRWRSLPEMLPDGHNGLVATQSPDDIAAALLRLALEEPGEDLRENFLAHFSLESHLWKLATAFRSVENF